MNIFSNIQEIGFGGFGVVFRTNYEHCLALKSFFNLNNSTVKEILHEVIIITMKIRL
jgi:hypothetical protein